MRIAVTGTNGQLGRVADGRQEAPPEEQLLAVSDAYVRFYREHPGFFHLFVFPPSDCPSPEAMPALAELIAGRIKAETERLAGAIGRAIESGAAREVDARSARRPSCGGLGMGSSPCTCARADTRSPTGSSRPSSSWAGS